MRFGVFLPPQATSGRVPVLYWLSGLTCTEENFIVKAGAQRVAAALGLAVVVPDTSPRGLGIPGESDSYDFGSRRRLLRRRNRGAVVARLPDVFVHHAGTGRRGCRRIPRGYEPRGDLRAFDGRPWGAHHCAQEPALLQVRVGLRPDRFAHALPVGGKGLERLSRRRPNSLAGLRRNRADRRARLGRARPSWSIRERRISSWRAS